MEQKQRFFIYDRKELGVLVLLGIMVAVFAFTLGIHLGKRLNPKQTHATGEAAPVETVQDKVPTKQELSEQAKGASEAADESLGQALRDEVARTGAKLDTPRQVELPEETKGERSHEQKVAEAPAQPEAHATTTPDAGHGEEGESHAQSPEHEAPKAAPAKQAAPSSRGGKFALQIGSFPVEAEARERANVIEGLGLQPLVREADIKGKGRWYRVFVGSFATKDEAERAGKRYQSQKVIDSFIVAKLATE